MGLFDKFKQKGSNPVADSVRREIERVYREEGIPLDASVLEECVEKITKTRLFRCPTKCGYDMVIHIGNSNPSPCPVCGRNLEELKIDLRQMPLEGRLRDDIAAGGHYWHAGQCFRKNDLRAALKALNRAIELDPEFVDAYYDRTEARIALGDLDGAIDDCDRVIQMTPNAADAYVNRGSAKAQKGDYSGCVEDTTKALSLGYSKPIAFFNRGMSFAQLSRLPEAISDLEKFLEMAPSDPRATSTKGFLRILKGS